MEIILTLVIGALAGWLGSVIFKGRRLGTIGNVVVGILGGFIGYRVLDYLDVSLDGGWASVALTSALGAMVTLAIVNLLVNR